MAKRGSKKRTEFLPWESKTIHSKHLRIADNMMESAAWAKLSVYAESIYLLMKKKYNRENADDISLTYKEGTAKMGQVRYTAALDELIDHGFIKIVSGGWTVQKATIFAFSDQWQHYGTKFFTVKPRPSRKAKKEE